MFLQWKCLGKDWNYKNAFEMIFYYKNTSEMISVQNRRKDCTLKGNLKWICYKYEREMIYFEMPLILLIL